MRRRRLLRAAAASASVPLLAGFEWPFAEHAERPSLLLAGSSLLLPPVRALAAEFMRANPQIDVVVEGGGSGSGLIALKRGAIDVAVMARDLLSAEYDLDTRNTLVGIDSLAVVLNPAAPVAELSVQELRPIFDGRTANWHELGGPDLAVEVCVAAPGAAARGSFDDLVMQGGDIARRATLCASPAEMRDAVARYPGAIGYLGAADLDDGVLPLALGGVALARRSLLLGTYRLGRPCFLVTHGSPSPAAASFIAFCLSVPMQQMLAARGVAAVR